jgi:hypothetical protein
MENWKRRLLEYDAQQHRIQKRIRRREVLASEIGLKPDFDDLVVIPGAGGTLRYVGPCDETDQQEDMLDFLENRRDRDD